MPAVDTSWEVQVAYDYDATLFLALGRPRVPYSLRVTVDISQVSVDLYGEIMASGLRLVDYEDAIVGVRSAFSNYLNIILGIPPGQPAARNVLFQRGRERALAELFEITRVPVMSSPPAAWTSLQGLLSQGGAATAAMVTADGELPKFLILYGAYAIVMSVEPLRSAVVDSVANRIRRWIDPEGQATGTPTAQPRDAPAGDAPPEPPTV